MIVVLFELLYMFIPYEFGVCCVPVEYWFIMNGVNTNTTPFAQQIEKKQKEATVDLSDLSFRTVTESGTTYLEVSTDGTNYTRVGTLPTSSADITCIAQTNFNIILFSPFS